MPAPPKRCQILRKIRPKCSLPTRFILCCSRKPRLRRWRLSPRPRPLPPHPSPRLHQKPATRHDHNQPRNHRYHRRNQRRQALRQYRGRIAHRIANGLKHAYACRCPLRAKLDFHRNLFGLVRQNLPARRFAIQLRLHVLQFFLNLHQVLHVYRRPRQHLPQIVAKLREILDSRIGVHYRRGLVFRFGCVLRDLALLSHIRNQLIHVARSHPQRYAPRRRQLTRLAGNVGRNHFALNRPAKSDHRFQRFRQLRSRRHNHQFLPHRQVARSRRRRSPHHVHWRYGHLRYAVAARRFLVRRPTRVHDRRRFFGAPSANQQTQTNQSDRLTQHGKPSSWRQFAHQHTSERARLAFLCPAPRTLSDELLLRFRWIVQLFWVIYEPQGL